MLKHGDIGLGTFERLNGEMIVVDGVCYQAVVDGSIVKTKAVVSTPFASVKFLHKDYTASLKDVKSIAELKGKLQAIVEENGVNSTYMGKLEGVFPKIVARSEYAQTPPYKPLAEVLKTDQKEFVFENVEGTVVMVYMPNYMEGVNTPGWHLHFVDKTRTKGGHVFDLALTDGDLILDKADGFYMTMPAGASFQGMDLTDVSKSDIAQVETGKTE